MKREGRQHGMVRSYRIMPSPFNPRPDPRIINRLESPPTAGVFTRVSTKPTNHSKFTGKCGRSKCSDCHIRPACKSKEKTKGTQKLKSSCGIVSSNWRVVDATPAGLKKFSGTSATGILDHLGSNHDDTDYYLEHDDHDADEFSESVIESAAAVEIKDNSDDDEMGFRIIWENIDGVDEENWCLVHGK